jgi:uncharacterized membrane protein YraQ (UPF0718 family)
MMKNRPSANKQKSGSKMLIPTLVMAVLAIVLTYFAQRQGLGGHITGLKWAYSTMTQILPLLIFAFIVAGMVQVLMPKELLSKWIGGASGWRGILIGSLAGGLAPGGPYVSLPIVAGLLKSGAGVGTMVAFLTGWSLWALGRIPMEIGILGWRFTLIRVLSTLVFPPIAGFVAQYVFGNMEF